MHILHSPILPSPHKMPLYFYSAFKIIECKNAMQKRSAKTQCKNAVQKCTAKTQCKSAKTQGKNALQNAVQKCRAKTQSKSTKTQCISAVQKRRQKWKNAVKKTQCKNALKHCINATAMLPPGNPSWREKHSTVDLLTRIAFFIKEKWLSVLKATDLNWLVQGGQLYWSLPFSKDSLLPKLDRFTKE